MTTPKVADKGKLRPLHMLVVEDSEDDVLLVVRQLKSAGHDVTFKRVESAQDMKRAITENSWDIVIADHSMPRFNALAALSILKASGLDLPFIIVSGTIGEDVAVAAMKAGAHDYIMKDNVARLVPAVERELHEAKVRQERRQAEEEVKLGFEKLRLAMAETIQSMALMAEMRDPYTAGHQRRVAELACAIAKEMELSEGQIEAIRMAAIIHDIGKIRIPAEILSMPNQLSDSEWSIIKMHPQIAYNIVKDIQFPWPVAKIVLQHHERMNGSGYPMGLSGDSILLEARVLGLADVVEAMVSHRPYRPARGLGKAMEEILHNRGSLYDAKVTDVCLTLFKNKGFKLSKSGN